MLSRARSILESYEVLELQSDLAPQHREPLLSPSMSQLFQPLAIETTRLDHRVAMAPLTRYRMDDDWNATALSKSKPLVYI